MVNIIVVILNTIRRIVPLNVGVSDSTEQKNGRKGYMLGVRGHFIVWDKMVTVEVGYMV